MSEAADISHQNIPQSFEREKALTFEEFTSMIPNLPVERKRYNNFVYFFNSGGFMADIYRANPYFIRFQSEFPQREAELTKELTSLLMNKSDPQYKQKLLACEKKLHEAYEVMRRYGATDKVLFD